MIQNFTKKGIKRGLKMMIEIWLVTRPQQPGSGVDSHVVYRSEFIWRVWERERYEWIQKCPCSGKEWNVLLFKKGIAYCSSFLQKWRRKNTLWYRKSSDPMRWISSVIYGREWRKKITKYQKVKLLSTACPRHWRSCFEWKRSRCLDKLWQTNWGKYFIVHSQQTISNAPYNMGRITGIDIFS